MTSAQFIMFYCVMTNDMMVLFYTPGTTLQHAYQIFHKYFF